jgi:hypothetical protein
MLAPQKVCFSALDAGFMQASVQSGPRNQKLQNARTSPVCIQAPQRNREELLLFVLSGEFAA